MDKQIKNEMDYQLSLNLMKSLLSKKLLTLEEFEDIKKRLLKKYQPYISILLENKLD